MSTTFSDLLAQLQEARDAVETSSPGSIEFFDLKIFALQLERQLTVSGFEPLSQIPAVAVPDLTRLRELTFDLKKAIADEKKRTELVGRILGTAKSIAGLAGLPIPL